MSIKKLMDNYTAYNLWANNTIAGWLSMKPIAFLEQEVASSFPCIAKTIVHIMETEKFWLSVIRADAAQPAPRWQKIDCTNQESLTGIVAGSREFLAYVHSLTEDNLLEDCTLDAPWMKGRVPRYEYIHHCMNHSTYHRGQIITIGRNIGLTDPPGTDYNYYNMVVLKR